METNKNIWTRWYMIILYIFIGLMPLGLMLLIVGLMLPDVENSVEVDNQNIEPLINSEYSKVLYLEDMQFYLKSLPIQTFKDTDIMYKVAYGEISLTKGYNLLEESEIFYTNLEVVLNDMEVPDEYTEYHNHVVKSVKYAKEGIKLSRQGLLYNDASYISMSTNKLNDATNELNKANTILNNL